MRRLIPLLLLFAPGWAWSLDTVQEIQDCLRANLPEKSASHDLRLTAEDAGGGRRELAARLYGKEVRSDRIAVMLSVSGPADLAGARYLLIDKGGRDDMYMYLPAVARTRRILGSMTSQPLWGTDFSYEDVKHIQGIMLDGEAARGDDAQLGERATYELTIRPAASEESAYSEIRISIDQQTCLVLQTEFVDEGGSAKRLIVDPESFREQSGRWLAHHFTMENLRSGTRSYLVLEGIEYDERLSANLFNPKTFHMAN